MTRKLLRAVLLCAGCWLPVLLLAPPARVWAQTGFDRPGGDYTSFPVRGGGVIESRGGDHEFGIDRVGGDYRHFDIPAGADASSCASACKGEARCRAWSYVRPGYQGPSGRCYLKSRITPPRRKPCCVSGVVR